ncbi:hypothetical protein F7725_020037, partial [Dissostichus mawsoni]
MERKHSKGHNRNECIDPENGVYAVHKAFHGTSIPLHVQNKVWGENQHVSCENNECQVNLELAWRSGIKAYQCTHLKSITYGSSYASPTELDEETLTEMVNNKWFGEDKKRLCLVRKTLPNVTTSLYLCTRKLEPRRQQNIYPYMSLLFHITVDWEESWCRTTQRRICGTVLVQRYHAHHKYIAKWHLFQTHRELFRKVRSTEEVECLSAAASTEDEHSHDEADLGDIPYPPKDVQKLKGMAQYILKHLRLPSVEVQYSRHLIPEERMCQHCPGNVPLSDPVLITHEAKILTKSRIVNDVSTYCKSCHQCGAHYRYQEWKDGLHNFNVRILLDLPLWLTNHMLQVHTAVSTVVEYLELTSGEQFPSADTVLHGYLHFEALTEHDYQYSCVSCVSDLPQPPVDFNGEVDMECFWDALSLERIGRGF